MRRSLLPTSVAPRIRETKDRPEKTRDVLEDRVEVACTDPLPGGALARKSSGVGFLGNPDRDAPLK